jgi:hypothetical protein
MFQFGLFGSLIVHQFPDYKFYCLRPTPLSKFGDCLLPNELTCLGWLRIATFSE